MSIVITGATGFIGKNLARKLADDNYNVKCLVRETSNLEGLHHKNIKLHYGDLSDKQSLEGLVGVDDVVYHLAGAVGSKDLHEYYQANLGGTKYLADICRNAKIKKFVYLSTASAVGSGDGSNIIDEKTPCNPKTGYGRSKREAEKLLLALHEKENFPAVILRAPIVYGPHDLNETRDLSMIKLIKYVSNGKFFVAGKNGGAKRSICYVGNLVEGAIASAKTAKTSGQIYFISDEKTPTLLELGRTIAKVCGIGLNEKRYPVCLANFIAYANEKISRLKGNFPQFNRRVVKGITSDWVCSIEKAKNDFGYKLKYDLETALGETIKWYKERGVVK